MSIDVQQRRRRAAALVLSGCLVAALPAGLAEAKGGNDSHGQGQSASAPGHSGQAPGQQRAPGQPAPPAAPAATSAPAAKPAPSSGEDHGKSKGHGKGRHHAASGKPGRHAGDEHAHGDGRPSSPVSGQSQSQRPSTPPPATPNPHANAGKVTICHATGSATNPYVEITISRNALPAHERHQDGRDIVPAPAGGCPKAIPSAPTQGASTPAAQSAPTPTPAPSPAPAVAPAVAVSPAIVPSTPLTGQGAPVPAPAVQVLGERASSPAPVNGHSSAPSGAVAGERAAGAAPAAATHTGLLARGQLPFTGLNLIVAFAVAMVLLLAGTALRRSGALRRTPSS